MAAFWTRGAPWSEFYSWPLLTINIVVCPFLRIAFGRARWIFVRTLPMAFIDIIGEPVSKRELASLGVGSERNSLLLRSPVAGGSGQQLPSHNSHTFT